MKNFFIALLISIAIHCAVLWELSFSKNVSLQDITIKKSRIVVTISERNETPVPRQKISANLKTQPKKSSRPKLSAVKGVDAGIVQPQYPQLSLEEGEEGSVTLEVNTTANGRVVDARVIESSGYLRLDKAALKAVLKTKNESPPKNLELPHLKKRLTFHFKLRDQNEKNKTTKTL